MKGTRSGLGIFWKVFLYTILILSFVIGVLYMFYSEQIRMAVTLTQQRQAAQTFQPLLAQLHGKSEAEIADFARSFQEGNDSLRFRFEDEDGDILFETDGFKMPDSQIREAPASVWFPGIADTGALTALTGQQGQGPGKVRIARLSGGALRDGHFTMLDAKGSRALVMTLAQNGIRLYVASPLLQNAVYDEFRGTIALALGATVVFALLAAFLFARRIATPIRSIAHDTHRMSALEDVPAPRPRGDEIGGLAADVYKMYEKLKETILMLEREIEREREMEENQRYFFSAASHELKTPIAAASSILEGILSGVVEPEEQPKYLRECMKLMEAQSGLVTEILDVMKTGDEKLRTIRVPVSLPETVANVLDVHRPAALQKGLRIETDVAGDIVCMLDPTLFEKALSNIVRNAVQNTGEDGEIRIRAEQAHGKTALLILNRKARIPETLLSKLFEPFYHANAARTSSQGGNGLGLTIVKQALERMCIAYSLANEGDGVLFRMELDLSNVR
ncbi:MAG: HAMP domain-containing histidine kinase [Clostridiales Family XIII bacterium]|jgi:two-component system sensor histidine kinase VanS|nr:HAMP domain-containing histidine kinase [Clostridiales Family XIII bacterium]